MDKKKRILTISLASLVILLAAAGAWFIMYEPEGFMTISPAEALELMESREDLIIIDVRGPDELWQGSIKGSYLIPFTEISQGRASLPQGRLESIEKLEQLRALEYGYKIKVVETAYDSKEVDRPEDVHRLESVLKQQYS